MSKRLLGLDVYPFDETEKERKRRILRENVARGKSFETTQRMTRDFDGWKVRKTGRGSDDYVTRTTVTGERQRKTLEYKSSATAPLSRLQKRTRRRKGDEYEVVRPE